jgi:hypothetical protein
MAALPTRKQIEARMPARNAILLLVVTLPLAWLLMQGVHELGHVLAAWFTGGEVERVVWHPLTISRTDLGKNPRPLVVAWAGPVGGILLPTLVWGILEALRIPLASLARFFAGFCWLANGLYIGFGSLEGIGDAGDLLRHGAPRWTLWLFGLIAAPAGLAFWNGVRTKMGLGTKAEPVAGRLIVWCAVALVALMAALFMLSG